MKTATFTLEREDKVVRVYSDLSGYCVWGTDLERVLASVIPLAQHLIFLNEKSCVVPKEFDPASLLWGKPVTVEFELVERLLPPKLLVEGDWWKTKKGRNFFVTRENGMVDKKSTEKLFAEVAVENSSAE